MLSIIINLDANRDYDILLFKYSFDIRDFIAKVPRIFIMIDVHTHFLIGFDSFLFRLI